ncbi:type I glyceraldehyde-3-phosphate dehydrogenase [Blattabacterium cuenoti]|uniref:type I glyceraldehyde-3-phosphate dehydrogenase n=1 Tax=Blattabacterium cuenoti TaxID=1653831 RepID=UPI00163C72B0|nr:type I glyceraldehyde-3-phosphate dehydrogenase [Blattabacterium cuenoti]
MSIKIGINGIGRIGKLVVLSALSRKNIEVVCINDLMSIEYLSYIFKYDSIHQHFRNNKIIVDKNYLIINGNKIKVTNEKNPKNLSWGLMGVEYVIESTGIFLNKNSILGHLEAGAKKVILSAPPKGDDIPMFIMGVNHKKISKNDIIISNASCTTNCLAPIVKVLNDKFGIDKGLMTTIHASTSSQNVVDSISHKDWRSGRSSLINIIPSSTGAASSLGKIIPNLNGKLTGMAFRVPISNVSVLDFTVCLKTNVNYNDIKYEMKKASETTLYGILGYTEEDVVSTDFLGDNRISIFDANASIMLTSNFIKIISWYDNEFGYSNKLLDIINYMNEIK